MISPGIHEHRRPSTRAALWTAALLSICSSTAAADEPAFTAADRAYWAWQPVRRVAPPAVNDPAWPRNAIDAFILARLDQAGISPAPEADRRTLIRRATYDLHGLPPTPEEVAAFLADPAPDAYERLIDRLLASPRYGERWARHWLDLVRYAESDGFKADDYRPEAWRYRDYVVEALNDDKPFDRFVSEQLAGDEIAPGDLDALVATTFLRHGPYESNQAHVRLQWENVLNEITDVAGQVFLGMTIRCARCHDHKYDSILQADYYRLQAFFAPLLPVEDAPLATAEEQAARREQLAAWEAATADLRRQMEEVEAPHRAAMRADQMRRFPKDIQALLQMDPAARTPLEAQLAALAERQLVVATSAMAGRMETEERENWERLKAQLAEFDHRRPADAPRIATVRDIGPQAPPTVIPGRESGAGIAPGFLSVLDSGPATIEPLPDASQSTSTGRRAALARWIASPGNPLTARVIANRLWQHHFGRGIVATPNDFGRQGELPTHPELLDWLASELVSRSWRLKDLHRLMMTSATYRQASLAAPSGVAASVDPENRLLWRMTPRRLEAEPLRDALLAVSGELNLRTGGPGVFPALPDDLQSNYAWEPTPDATEHFRRSIFLAVKRNLRDPLLDAFDPPDSHDTCARRETTTTAPQALVMLNGDWTLARAAALAGRVMQNAATERETIAQAYELALSRPATDEELDLAERFLAEQSAALAAEGAAGRPLALPAPLPPGADRARVAALVDFCHALLNSNEFLYVD